MLIDLEAIEKHGVTIHPVWADDPDGNPEIILWQVGLVKPMKMLGHHIGRVPPETGADGPTLLSAILKFADKSGVSILLDTDAVARPYKEVV